MANKKLCEPIAQLDNATIYKDFGSFGEGKWQFHLTLCSWFGGEPKYDLRRWNNDFTQCRRGIVLDNSDLFDLLSIIEDVLDGDEN